MKRRFLFIILLIPLLFSCIRSGDDDAFPSVVALDFPSYDIARSVLGGKGKLSMLLYPGLDAHGYDLSPDELVKLTDADLFVYTGGESDEWIKRIVGEEGITSFSLLDESVVKLDEVTDDIFPHHHHEGGVDEHVWTSFENQQVLGTRLAAALGKIDEANAGYYIGNANERGNRLADLEERFRQLLSSPMRRKIVIADRFPLLYFATEFSIDYVSLFPSCVEESEPSMKKVAYLVDTVRKEGIPIVFKVDLSSDMYAKAIADETGARVSTLYSGHGISKFDFESGVTFIDLMEKNLDALKEALY